MTLDFLLINALVVPAEIFIIKAVKNRFGILGFDGLVKLEWINPGCMLQRV